MNITCATVNKMLKEHGIKERLCKGNGYMFFCEGDSDKWYSTMVCVTSANSLTLEQWLFEYNNLKGE